jgi:hypothetical protein
MQQETWFSRTHFTNLKDKMSLWHSYMSDATVVIVIYWGGTVLMFLCKAVVRNHPSACTASCGWQFLLQKIQFILQGNWGATLLRLLSRGLWNCSNNRTSLVHLLSNSVPQGPRMCSTHQPHCCNFSCLALVIKHIQTLWSLSWDFSSSLTRTLCPWKKLWIYGMYSNS